MDRAKIGAQGGKFAGGGVGSRRRRRISGTGTVLAVLGGWGFAVAAGAAPLLKAVSLSGDAMPGVPGDKMSLFEEPVVNATGQVAFHAWSARQTPVQGIFRGDAASGLVAVALPGQALPGGGTFPPDHFSRPMINDAGSVLVVASAVGRPVGTNLSDGVYRFDPSGAATVLAQTVTPAPGTTSTIGGILGATFPLDSAGRSTFAVALKDGSVTPLTDKAMYSSDGRGGLTLLGRNGSPWPNGTTEGNVFGSIPRMNRVGQFVFGTGSGIYRGAAGSAPMSTVAAFGGAAPGVAGGLYRSFGSIILDDTGHVGFVARVGGLGGVPTAEKTGVFRADSAGLVREVAWSDTPLPDGNGRLGEFAWESAQTPLAMDGAGRATLASEFLGTQGGAADDSGIVRAGGGTLEIIAREGQLAPGAGGQRFGHLAAARVFTNAAGQLAFTADLGQADAVPDGLWVLDGSGAVEAVAVIGQRVEVRPGDWRTVSSISTRGASGADGTSPLSDTGYVAFRLGFDGDQSWGVFTAQVPEPAWAGAAGLAGLMGRRRRIRMR